MTAVLAERQPAPLDYLDDLDAFRSEIRAWLQAVLPHDWKRRLLDASEEQYVEFQRWWFDELRKVRLANAHWPRAWGGEELSLRHSIILNEELARAEAPRSDMFTISLFHLPASLFAHGTAEQRERYLTGVRDRGEVWCQGFSEPGAGSDLASLRVACDAGTTHGPIPQRDEGLSLGC
jgi:alkylation response protein AidB-like acyl-CoA dehydrogenase